MKGNTSLRCSQGGKNTQVNLPRSSLRHDVLGTAAPLWCVWQGSRLLRLQVSNHARGSRAQPAVSNSIASSRLHYRWKISNEQLPRLWLCLAFHPTVLAVSIDSNGVLGIAGKVPIRSTASSRSTNMRYPGLGQSGVVVWGLGYGVLAIFGGRTVAYIRCSPAVSLQGRSHLTLTALIKDVRVSYPLSLISSTTLTTPPSFKFHLLSPWQS